MDWFAEEEHISYDKQFLMFCCDHFNLHGDASFHYASAAKNSGYPALKERNNRFRELIVPLQQLGVTVETSGRKTQFSVKSAEIRDKLQSLSESAPKDWLEEAGELVAEYGQVWMPEINMARELRNCLSGTSKEQNAAAWCNWFRRARLPALQSSDYYLIGKNRDGEERLAPPYTGIIQ